ncbi:glycoside hydrolase family 6 protein [Sodiomyces alcalophilus JCM 7366]|uniref:glycoside hydrolase family 6 protein n=1 Tax=Sodiomyces alcalophilus JCM 7366 TaxID=591952 RepID=UPI0039B4C22C
MTAKNLFLTAALGTAALALPHHCRSGAYEGNPFADIQLYPDPYYVDEIQNIAIPQMNDTELIRKAEVVAGISTFQWLDIMDKIPLMNSTLHEIRAANNAGANPPYAATLVIYNFPDRDCSAKASAGELHIDQDGVNIYKTQYIDPIRDLVEEFSDIRIIFAYEPDGLANLITNMEVPKCANAAPVYREVTEYALSTLNLPNVAIYIDAGHAGWLGWEGNLALTAAEYAEVYHNAGSPRAVRGLVTNVSNFNGYNLTEPPAFTEPNENWDESKFHAAIAPHLEAEGFPAHFIVDLGRAGQQPGGREEWGHWCNVKDSGFGPRPNTDTGIDLLDAVVWVKPGGEGDGTSDPNAARFDETCQSPSAFVPAPEAGAWFQEYFVMLLENANPPL